MKVFTTRGVRVRERKKEREFFSFFVGVSFSKSVENVVWSFWSLRLFFSSNNLLREVRTQKSFLLAFRKKENSLLLLKDDE